MWRLHGNLGSAAKKSSVKFTDSPGHERITASALGLIALPSGAAAEARALMIAQS